MKKLTLSVLVMSLFSLSALADPGHRSDARRTQREAKRAEIQQIRKERRAKVKAAREEAHQKVDNVRQETNEAPPANTETATH